MTTKISLENREKSVSIFFFARCDIFFLLFFAFINFWNEVFQWIINFLFLITSVNRLLNNLLTLRIDEEKKMGKYADKHEKRTLGWLNEFAFFSSLQTPIFVTLNTFCLKLLAFLFTNTRSFGYTAKVAHRLSNWVYDFDDTYNMSLINIRLYVHKKTEIEHAYTPFPSIHSSIYLSNYHQICDFFGYIFYRKAVFSIMSPNFIFL